MNGPVEDAPDAKAQAKAQWRDWARARRAALPDVSPALSAQLAAWLRARGARRVLAYHAFDGEPDLGVLAGEFELLTTRARWRPTPHLTLHPWSSASQRNRHGLLEPPPGAPEASPQGLDVVLVPGLAFDERGVRLGYGGGFYDRLLAGLDATRVGVVQGALVVRALPGEPHDVPVQFLATETGVRAALT